MMRVVSYADPAAYLQRVEAVLEQREVENNLILGIATRLVEQPGWEKFVPYLGVVEDEGGQIALVAAMTPPFRMLLAAPPDSPHLDAACAQLIESLRSGDWYVPGVNAESGLSERFARAWQAITGQGFERKMRLRAYQLKQVIPPPNPPHGCLREVTEADIDLITRWRVAFMKEAMGEEEDEANVREIVAKRIAARDTYFWDDHGPVSMCVRTRPTKHGISIGAVYTPPEKRGHGYASACVAAVSQMMLDSGKQYCTLFTDLDYPTSNEIYQKLGYVPVCDFTEYIFL